MHSQDPLPLHVERKERYWHNDNMAWHVQPAATVRYQHPIPGLEMGRSTLHPALSHLQFHHEETATNHWLTATDGGPDEYAEGVLTWSKDPTGTPGEIQSVSVNPFNTRRGLATAMIETARNMGIQPAPQHSSDRSDAGDAWAAHVGGHLPKNKWA